MRAFFHNRRSAARREGQVVIFLLMLLTALAFVLLWNVDLHRIVTLKTRAQNAGDAAALAGARWQGIALNLVGELNLLHALALSARDDAGVEAITNMQARLLFTGPLMGVAAAQVAAKNNGMYAEDAFSSAFSEHAATVRANYGRDTGGGGVLFGEPYQDAWNDYASMLEALANDGIAAGPDSTFFYNDREGDHILMDKDFYNAVAGKTWCWFFLYHRDLLNDYSGYGWWPPLPPPTTNRVSGCEFLPLGVEPYTAKLRDVLLPADPAALLDEATRLNAVNLTGVSAADTNVFDRYETWYVYNEGWWGPWSLMAPEGDQPLPLAGPVREAYNYAGADAAFRVHAVVNRMTPGLDGGARTDAVLWTAAAKPFGTLGPQGSATPPTRYGLVLPCFTDARLIPVDASRGGVTGGFDLAWREHVNVHLPHYLETGQGEAGCWYCAQLGVWENAAFRQEGVTWLAKNSYLCTLPDRGGAHGGGAHRGH
jgi:hypothetical protein